MCDATALTGSKCSKRGEFPKRMPDSVQIWLLAIKYLGQAQDIVRFKNWSRETWTRMYGRERIRHSSHRLDPHTFPSLSAGLQNDVRNGCAIFMIRMSHSMCQRAVCVEFPTQATVPFPLMLEGASVAKSHSTLHASVLVITRVALYQTLGCNPRAGIFTQETIIHKIQFMWYLNMCTSNM